MGQCRRAAPEPVVVVGILPPSPPHPPQHPSVENFPLKIPWGVANCESHILRSEQTDILKCPCFPIIEQRHYEQGSKCLLLGKIVAQESPESSSASLTWALERPAVGGPSD